MEWLLKGALMLLGLLWVAVLFLGVRGVGDKLRAAGSVALVDGDEVMNDSQLTTKARGIARRLTYNADTPQAEAKHMLLELAHRLDALNVHVNGGFVVNAAGKYRRMTLSEHLKWLLFGVLPRKV